MINELLAEFSESVNQNLSADEVLKYIDYEAAKLQTSGSTIKAFCCVHKDNRFRSLLIDTEKNSFKCTLKTCPGSTGGNLVQLLHLSKEVSLLQAIKISCNELNAAESSEWEDNICKTLQDIADSTQLNNNLDETEKALQALIELKPSDSHARFMLAELCLKRDDPSDAAEQFIHLAEAELNTNRADQAEQSIHKAMKLIPDNEDLMFMLVRCAEQKNDPTLIIKRLNDIVEAREQTERSADNIGVLQRILELAPDSVEHRLKLATLHEARHDLKKAGTEFEKAAASQLQNGNKAEAVELLEKVVRYEPEMLKVRLKLATLLLEENHHDEARKHTFAVINSQIDQQDYASSVKTIKDWLKNEPENIEARELLARIYQEQERIEETAEILREAAAIAEQNNNNEKAADLLLRTKFITPESQDVRHDLIRIFNAQKEYSRAALEVIDLAEYCFVHNNIEEGCDLLKNCAQTPLPTALKCQICETLKLHNKQEDALRIIEDIQNSITPETSPDEALQIYQTICIVNNASPKSAEKIINFAWEKYPSRAGEITVETLSLAKAHGTLQSLQNLTSQLVDNFSDYNPSTLQFLNLTLDQEDFDTAGTVYLNTIGTMAEQTPDAALKIAKKIAELIPDHPSAFSDCAYLLNSLGKHTEASQYYTKLAYQLYSNHDFENAFQYAEEAVNNAPDNQQAHYLRCLIATHIFDGEELESYLDQLKDKISICKEPILLVDMVNLYLTHHPDDITCTLEAADNYISMGLFNEGSSRYYDAALYHFKQDEQIKAKEYSEKSIKYTPDDPKSLTLYAKTLEHVPDFVKASEYYARAASLQLNFDIDEAEKNARDAIRLSDTNKFAYEILLDIYEDKNDVDQSAATCRKLIELAQTSANRPDIVKNTEKLTRFVPEDTTIWIDLANLYQGDNNPSAVSALDKALTIFLESHNWEETHRLLVEKYSEIVLSDEISETLRITIPNVPAQFRSKFIFFIAQNNCRTNNPERAANVLEYYKQYIADESEGLAETWEDIAVLQTDRQNESRLWKKAASYWEQIPGKEVRHLRSLYHATNTNHNDIKLIKKYVNVYTSFNLNDESSNVEDHLISLLSRYLEQQNNNWKQIHDFITSLPQVKGETLYLSGKILNDYGHFSPAFSDFKIAAATLSAQQKYDLVLEICDAAKPSDESNESFTKFRSEALFALKEQQEATEWARNNVAEFEQENRFSDALAITRQWINKSPNDIEALEKHASLLVKNNEKNSASDTYIKMAQLYLDSNDEEKALNNINQALTLNPDSIEAFPLQIKILENNGDTQAVAENNLKFAYLLAARDQADAALEKIELAFPNISPSEDDKKLLSKLLVNVHGNEKSLPYATKWLNLVICKESPDTVLAYYGELIEQYPNEIKLTEDYIASLRSFNKLTSNTELFNKLSYLYEANNQFEKAAHALTEYTELEQELSAEIYDRLGGYRQQAHNVSGAVQSWRIAANSYYETGNPQNALNVTNKILDLSIDTLNPNDYILHARCLQGLGRTKDALTAYSGALNMLVSPDRETRATRLQLLESALELDPLNAEFLTMLINQLPINEATQKAKNSADSLDKLGRENDARKILAAASTLDPFDFDLRKRLITNLQATETREILWQELSSFIADAATNNDSAACEFVINELTLIANSAADHIAIAKLCEEIQDKKIAAEHYTAAAEDYARQNKPELAASTLQKAVSINTDAISANSIVFLVNQNGSLVQDIAAQLFQSSLVARNLSRSLTISSALLDKIPPTEYTTFLKNVSQYGGSGFVVAIAKNFFINLTQPNDKEKSLALMQSVQDVTEDNPDAWHLASEIARACGFFGDAKQAAMQAATLYRQIGAVSEEESCLLEILNDSPDDPVIRESLAQFYIREKNPTAAFNCLQHIINNKNTIADTVTLKNIYKLLSSIEPDNIDYQAQYAQFLENKNSDQAILSWYQIAEKYYVEKLYKNAIETYSHILTIDPSQIKALKNIYSISVEIKDTSSISSSAQNLANFLKSENKITEAIRHLHDATTYSPNDLSLLKDLAETSLEGNDTATYIFAIQSIGYIHLENDDLKSAAKQFKLGLQYQPKNITLITLLLSCLNPDESSENINSLAEQLLAIAVETNDSELHFRAASQLVELAPDNPDYKMHLAQSQTELNMQQDAVKQFSEAGDILEHNEQYSRALECYYKISKIAPDNLDNWRKIANIAARQQNHELHFEAVRLLLDKATQSNNSEIALSLASELLEIPLDHTKEIQLLALRTYKHFNINDKQTEVLLTLIGISFRTNSYEEANVLINALEQIDPNYPDLVSFKLDLAKSAENHEDTVKKLREGADKAISENRNSEAIHFLTELLNYTPSPLESRRLLIPLLESEELSAELTTHRIAIIPELLAHRNNEEALNIARLLVSDHNAVNCQTKTEIADKFIQFDSTEQAAELFSEIAEQELQSKNWSEALNLVRNAIKYSSVNTRLAKLGLDSATSANDPDGIKEFSTLLLESYISEKQYDNAIALIPAIVNNTQPDIKTLSMVAEAYEQTGSSDNEIHYRKQLADQYATLNEKTNALTNINRLRSIAGNDPEVQAAYIDLIEPTEEKSTLSLEYVRLAEMFAAQHNIEAATKTYEHALTLNDQATTVRAKFATFLVSQDQKIRAASEMQKLAIHYLEEREYQAAIEILNAALQLSPLDTSLIFNLASAQEAIGNTIESKANYDKATEILSQTKVSKDINSLKQQVDDNDHATIARKQILQLYVISGDLNSALREAKDLIETYIARKDFDNASLIYTLIDNKTNTTADEIKLDIQEASIDLTMQYIHLIRLGDNYYSSGDIHGALDTYRNARSLQDDRISIIQKCINCLVLIAPEQEAIPDYLAIAEKQLMKNDLIAARKTYETVRAIDPFNADAKMGIAAVNAAERKSSSESVPSDNLPLHSPGKLGKGIGIQELLSACKITSKDD